MKKTETEYMNNLNNELPHKKLRQVIKKIFNHLLLKFIDYNSSKGRNRKFPKEETVHVSENSSPSFKRINTIKTNSQEKQIYHGANKFSTYL